MLLPPLSFIRNPYLVFFAIVESGLISGEYTFLNKSSRRTQNEKDWAKSQVFLLRDVEFRRPLLFFWSHTYVVETKLNFTCAVKKYG